MSVRAGQTRNIHEFLMQYHLDISLAVLNELGMHIVCHWNGIPGRMLLSCWLRTWPLWRGQQFGCVSCGYKIIKLISLHHQKCLWERFRWFTCIENQDFTTPLISIWYHTLLPHSFQILLFFILIIFILFFLMPFFLF